MPHKQDSPTSPSLVVEDLTDKTIIGGTRLATSKTLDSGFQLQRRTQNPPVDVLRLRTVCSLLVFFTTSHRYFGPRSW